MTSTVNVKPTTDFALSAAPVNATVNTPANVSLGVPANKVKGRHLIGQRKNKVSALSIKNLKKQYPSPDGGDPIHAVDGIDVEIKPGEIVAFLGPNGAGKTTTLDMVLGLIDPTSGTVEVFGQSPREAVNAGQVSAVLQTGGLLRDLTVQETIRAIAALHGISAKDPRITDIMTRTDLNRLAKRKVGKCSGGEQQRIRFALALLSNPKLLILDEPTAGMDAAARRAFWETMRAETHSGERTVIFATHYLEEAQAFAPRTILVGHGRVVADKPTDELRNFVGSRKVDATLVAEPGSTQFANDLARLETIPGVQEVRSDGNRVTISGSTSDDVARVLLNELSAFDLEIATPTLESAFFALTD